jgi:hypothetical protein
MRTSLLLLVFFSFALAGCVGEAAKTYTYTPPSTPGGRMCAVQCDQARNFCQENCDLDDRSCVTNVQGEALRDYDNYVRTQFANHQSATLLPRDFERTNSCAADKNACYSKCESTYGMCYENCGGKVNVTSSCQFLCF